MKPMHPIINDCSIFLNYFLLNAVLFILFSNYMYVPCFTRGATDSFFTDFLGCRKARKREEKEEKVEIHWTRRTNADDMLRLAWFKKNNWRQKLSVMMGTINFNRERCRGWWCKPVQPDRKVQQGMSTLIKIKI